MDWITANWPALLAVAGALGLTRQAWWPSVTGFVTWVKQIAGSGKYLSGNGAIVAIGLLFAGWWLAGKPQLFGPLPPNNADVLWNLTEETPPDVRLQNAVKGLGEGLTPDQRHRLALCYWSLSQDVGGDLTRLTTSAAVRDQHVARANALLAGQGIPRSALERIEACLLLHLDLKNEPLTDPLRAKIKELFFAIAWGILR